MVLLCLKEQLQTLQRHWSRVWWTWLGWSVIYVHQFLSNIYQISTFHNFHKRINVKTTQLIITLLFMLLTSDSVQDLEKLQKRWNFARWGGYSKTWCGNPYSYTRAQWLSVHAAAAQTLLLCIASCLLYLELVCDLIWSRSLIVYIATTINKMSLCCYARGE